MAEPEMIDRSPLAMAILVAEPSIDLDFQGAVLMSQYLHSCAEGRVAMNGEGPPPLDGNRVRELVGDVAYESMGEIFRLGRIEALLAKHDPALQTGMPATAWLVIAAEKYGKMMADVVNKAVAAKNS